MKLEYELTAEDYIKFNIFHMENSKSIKQALQIQRFLIPAFYLLMPFLLTKMSDSISFTFWMVAFIIASVIWILFYPKYVNKVTAKRINKMVKEGKCEDLLGSHTVTLSDEEFVDNTKNSESKVNWSGIERFVQTNEYIFVYVSSIMANIIPKRAFETADKQEEFLNILKTKIKS